MWFKAFQQFGLTRILRVFAEEREYQRIMSEVRLHKQRGEFEEALLQILPLLETRPSNVYLRHETAILQQQLNKKITLPPLQSKQVKSEENSVIPEKTLVEQENYAKAERAQKQIETQLMADPNVVSLGIRKSPEGEYELDVGVLSQKIYRDAQANKEACLMEDFVELEPMDAMHEKNIVPVRIIETTMPTALTEISSDASQTKPQNSRIVSDDDSSTQEPVCSDKLPPLSNTLFSNQTTRLFNYHSPEPSSNYVKYALVLAGFFVTAAAVCHFTAKRSEEINPSGNDLTRQPGLFTIPPGYTPLTERIMPEQMKAINPHNNDSEKKFKSFSNY